MQGLRLRQTLLAARQWGSQGAPASRTSLVSRAPQKPLDVITKPDAADGAKARLTAGAPAPAAAVARGPSAAAARRLSPS